MRKMRIPIDNESAKEKYDDMCCGQACLSVIQNIPISATISQWEFLFNSFYGFSKWKDLRKYLEVVGYKVKQIRWNKLDIVNPNSYYILRVQWLGDNVEKIDKPFYGWGWWTEASANTHFILLYNGKVFCNSDGIFDYNKLSDYLGDSGLITSALEINIEQLIATLSDSATQVSKADGFNKGLKAQKSKISSPKLKSEILTSPNPNIPILRPNSLVRSQVRSN